MKRFLILPSATTLCFFFWVAASATELMLMTWPAFLARNPGNAPARIAELSSDFFGSIWQTCVWGGVVAGLIWATADWMAHRSDQGVALRLLSNLFWCGFYATLLVASNGIVCYASLLYYLRSNLKSPVVVEEFALHVCLGINALALAYAIIQTVTTPRVLSPHTLAEAFKKRSRLQ